MAADNYFYVYSLQDCYANDSFDFDRYRQYKKRELEEEEEYNAYCTRLFIRSTPFAIDSPHHKKRRTTTTRGVKRHKLMVLNDDGTERELRPQDTLWYLLYIKNRPRDDRQLRKFRRRFRLPYDNFL